MEIPVCVSRNQINLENLGIPEHAAFLQKPIDPDVLAKIIREVLDTDDLRMVS